MVPDLQQDLHFLESLGLSDLYSDLLDLWRAVDSSGMLHCEWTVFCGWGVGGGGERLTELPLCPGGPGGPGEPGGPCGPLSPFKPKMNRGVGVYS